MAFRAPRFSYFNYTRLKYGDAAGNLTLGSGESASASFPLSNVVDERDSVLFKFSTSYTNPSIIMNMDSTNGVNRLIIPANHNVAEVFIEQADDITFVTNKETLHASDSSPVPGTLYDSGEFDTLTQSRQYIRVTFIGTGTYELGELFYTDVMTFSAAPNLQNSSDEFKANATRLEHTTGASPTIQHGPQQRVIEYEYESPLSGTDLTNLEALVAEVGMAFPFYIDPASFSTPPETDEPALSVKFASMPRTRNSILVPSNGTRSKTFTLDLIEAVD